MNSEIKTQICDEYFEFLSNLETSSFDELMKKVFSLNHVKFNELNWKLSIYSCS
jgi:hypothetical protein